MSALYALSAFLMTLAGGWFAFRYQKYLLYIMAFSAGVLLGVVFLDVVPEVVELAQAAGLDFRMLMGVLIAGFVAIFLLEKMTIIHSEKTHDAPGHHH
ncbi:MAG TPA: ZIP family metal transporter, partial [Thermoanaerobaculia bacterium]|nr:ZIP family metal transporter [Thermoanaerobaculia bacterium]